MLSRFGGFADLRRGSFAVNHEASKIHLRWTRIKDTYFEPFVVVNNKYITPYPPSLLPFCFRRLLFFLVHSPLGLAISQKIPSSSFPFTPFSLCISFTACRFACNIFTSFFFFPLLSSFLSSSPASGPHYLFFTLYLSSFVLFSFPLLFLSFYLLGQPFFKLDRSVVVFFCSILFHIPEYYKPDVALVVHAETP